MNKKLVEHDAHGEIAVFIAKWRAREPEMAFAEVFCPRDHRRRFALWGALTHEWREAAFELSDVRPKQAKCGWWADEAVRSAQGAPRHPLTVALSMPALPWLAMSRGLAAMADEDPAQPVDCDAALTSVASLADPMAAMEAALFDAQVSNPARLAAAVHLLGERLRFGLAMGSRATDGGRLPLSLLARHGVTATQLSSPEGERALRDWASELAMLLPTHFAQTAFFRRARASFDAWHLRQRAAGRTQRLFPLNALFRAWRSARQADAG